MPDSAWRGLPPFWQHQPAWQAPAPIRAVIAEWRSQMPGPAEAQALSGFMMGFIDLVFQGEDKRWYLLDWKSNTLDGTPASFTLPRLHQEMAKHRYFLQYLIYIVALDRHLRQTLPGYDYDRDFGGVYYVFLRGWNQARPA